MRLFEQHELQACQFLAKFYHELNKNIVSGLLNRLDRVVNRYCQYIILVSFELAWRAGIRTGLTSWFAWTHLFARSLTLDGRNQK